MEHLLIADSCEKLKSYKQDLISLLKQAKTDKEKEKLKELLQQVEKYEKLVAQTIKQCQQKWWYT